MFTGVQKGETSAMELVNIDSFPEEPGMNQ